MRPDRSDKPRHPGFHRKPKAEKKPPLRQGAAAAAADPYQDGKLRLFLDDERKCPPGWTLVKTVEALRQAIKACNPADLAAISLDWYLGAGIENGHKAVDFLVEHLTANAEAFLSLESIYCHSSDPDERGRMAYTLARAIMLDDILPDIDIRPGHPMGWCV